ncbi:hypothetical protein ILYODFUR_026414 [Ilyodon furcidens]|uniref:Uncharacterized protein n=1 Tax=Ilyodon furcidens TaxID=33524 RepID=A0ABV0VHC5_9TELE
MLQSRVNHHNPTTSRALRNSRRISSTPGALPPRSFLITSMTSAPEIGEPAPQSPGSTSSVEDMPVFEALPEVGVEAPPHGRLRQAFPAYPQDLFGHNHVWSA